MKFWIIPIVMLVFSSANQQEINCLKAKTGSFKYLGEDYSDWTVKRNDSIQIEANEHLGLSIQSSIKWLSDCKFEMTYTKVDGDGADHLIGTKVQCSITEISGDTITLQSKSENGQYTTSLLKLD